MIKKIAILALLIFCTLILPSRFKLLTYGFKLEKLQLQMPPSSEWEVEPILSQGELEQIFSQSFSFLGKGAQSYVFESADGNYVLKLFRFDHRKSSFVDRDRWDLWKEEKALLLFTSCKLGWELAKEETALLHLHLNCTTNSLPILLIKTPLKRTLSLPLDRCRFALQRKAIPLLQALERASADGTLNQKMEAVTRLLEKRTAKGIGNRDPSLWRNFGFVGDEAIEIDFGGYIMRPDFVKEEARQGEMERYLAPLKKWAYSSR